MVRIMKKIGIIGMSEGNGHPYSWSAIFNGYNPEFMNDCPFPVIPQYLNKETFPEATLGDAFVTHIWTQNPSISEHISKATYIPHIVEDYIEMIGKVDAILLARDDYDNHYEMAKPFLAANLPIYIDKPLAINTKEAKKIFELEKYEGQIFTCSALQFAKEFNLLNTVISEVGKITFIEAYVMKDWEKYGVHIIEPVLNIIGDQGNIVSVKKSIINDRKTNIFTWDTGLVTAFTAMGDSYSELKINIIGDKGSKELIFKDTFYAFKSALLQFVKVIKEETLPPSKEFVLKVVDIIERGV